MAPWHPFKRPIAAVVIAAQLALVLQPLSVLAQDKGVAPFNPQAQSQLNRLNLLARDIEQAKAAQARAEQSSADRASERLTQIEEISKTLRTDRQTIQVGRRMSEGQRQRKQQDLMDLLSQTEADIQSHRAEFAKDRAELQAKQLPADILARHDEAMQQFEQRSAQFRAIAQKLQSSARATASAVTSSDAASPDAASLDELDAFFTQFPNRKRHTPMDPDKLPWGSPKATPRFPAESKTAWDRQLNKDYYAGQQIKLAQAGPLSNIGGVQFTTPPEPTQAPQNADLAETADVQLTAAIRAKAQELGYNPVNIANWVGNNIQWLPTWGSIQGADGTLKTRRGNAFDTASLTIALLRASGIPARYQFGTIDVPADKVNNWVGGVQKPEVALNLLYQGGIAARGLVSAGQIQTIRMEHVWVNAYVNWTPSRGNRQGGGATTPAVLGPHGQAQHPNPNANLNAWTPIDASYKQYTYTQGMNLQAAVPLDASALVTAVQQGATVTPNYAQNLNQANLQTQVDAYQRQINSYIKSQKTNASAEEVLGAQVIRTRNNSLLPGTAPYPIIVLGNERSEIPDDLRWKVSFLEYEIGGGQGSALIDRTFNLSALLGSRVGVTYEGATLADQQAITNYRISGSASFPAYAIRVRPLFQIDGNTVVTGEAVGMAKEVEWHVNVIPAGVAATSGNLQTYAATAGDETVWAVVADAVSATQLQSMSFPPTASGNLHAVGMSFWHQVDGYAKLIARRENAVVQRMPSLGAISSGLTVQYIWGIPRNAFYRSRTMDIGHSTIGAQGMDNVVFQRELGMRTSYLEGNIFDQVFNRETGTGISAMRLIQTALESGQRVFTLNSGNADQFLGQIQMSNAVREDIINYLIMGLEVTIPESNQTVNGWTGTAYTAIRPETGAGSYIISGGQRGGAEGSDCQLQPATSPASATNFSPAVLFAAAIIAAYLIASLAPVLVPLLLLAALAQSATAAPVPQLPPPLDGIWNGLSAGRPWPSQFNWPPRYGTPPLPYGSCTPEQHAALEATKDAACNNPLAKLSCDPNQQSCLEMQQKIAAKENCIAARVDVMTTCFQGGDAGHWEQVQNLLRGIAKCEKCLGLKVAAQQCTK